MRQEASRASTIAMWLNVEYNRRRLVGPPGSCLAMQDTCGLWTAKKSANLSKERMIQIAANAQRRLRVPHFERPGCHQYPAKSNPPRSGQKSSIVIKVI
jgi:hypothetical protein